MNARFTRSTAYSALLDTLEDCAAFAVIMAAALVWAVM